MSLKELHFAYPVWLWGLLAIPLVWALFYFLYRSQSPIHHLEKFIDRHLLPFLVSNPSNNKRSWIKALFLWSAVWGCCTLALAGPRWNYREIDMLSRDQSLVVLLDLSESMNATDIKPSRLVLAKQKIEDIIQLSKGVKMGLIAFAADPHMIAPITDDKEMIRHLLPSLETSLVYVQGSRLSVALDMASGMLEAEPGSNKAILVISDGGFEDGAAMSTAKKLMQKGIYIHAMAIGSMEGALIQDHQGNIIKKNGAPILSKLEQEKLKDLSKVGNGRYLEGGHLDHDETLILQDLEKRSDAQLQIGKKNRIWEEGFFFLLLPALLIVLWWFKRGYVFSAILFLLVPFWGLEASSSQSYFKNSEELGKEAMEREDYEKAAETFQDPYRIGVAHYKAGNFAEAEKMFLQSSREEVSLQAAYNLGNALAKQLKFQEAIAAYEDVLKKWPDCTHAKENLELVKNLLQEQEQDTSSQDDQNSQKGDSQEGQGEGSKTKDSQDQQNKEGSKQSQDSSQNKEGSSQKEDIKQGSQAQEHKESQGNEDSKETKQAEKKSSQEEDKKDGAKIGESKAEGHSGTEGEVNGKSQEEQDADLWLNRISNDPKTFLKNKFYIESKNNGTVQGVDPW